MMGGSRLNDVSCIVVHHNSPETLVHTLRALVGAGLAPTQILVVDNSTDPGQTAAAAAEGFEVVHTANRGYAAAVNDGMKQLAEAGRLLEYTLIATHESLAAPEAVLALRDELAADHTIAVAGPTLLNAGADMQVWSVGGRLSPTLKLPRHFVDADVVVDEKTVDRDWLDGAFALYRTSDLESFPLDESYFLYFEETDLHTRLNRAGKRVVWVPRARVSQRSSGIPPRLLGRNLFRMHAKLFSRFRGRFAVMFELVRATARAFLTKRGRWSDVPSIAAGWLQAERELRTATPEDQSSTSASSGSHA